MSSSDPKQRPLARLSACGLEAGSSGVYLKVNPSRRGRRAPAYDRHKIIELLEQRRYEDVLALLLVARQRRPRDLEILRSIRILELHLNESSVARATG